MEASGTRVKLRIPTYNTNSALSQKKSPILQNKKKFLHNKLRMEIHFRTLTSLLFQNSKRNKSSNLIAGRPWLRIPRHQIFIRSSRRTPNNRLIIRETILSFWNSVELRRRLNSPPIGAAQTSHGSRRRRASKPSAKEREASSRTIPNRATAPRLRTHNKPRQ